MLRYLLVFSIYVLCVLFECNAQNEIKACIIQVENGKVYLDATSSNVRVGDVLSVRSTAGYMIHPVTKKKIAKEGEIIADLEIKEIYSEYSIASIYPETAISKLKAGMYASMPELKEDLKTDLIEDVIDEDYENEVDENHIDATLIHPQSALFNTAEDVIKWHNECTGLSKLKGNNSYGVLVEEEIIYKNKKGKEKMRNHFVTIVHLPTDRLYMKTNLYMDIPLSKDINVSRTMVVNGIEGWVNEGKKAKPMKDKERFNLLNNLKNGMDAYLNGDYDKILIGEQYVEGKKCVGIRMGNRKTGHSFRNYYDLSNGWLVVSYVESKDGEEVQRVKEYRNFNGIMKPSIVEITDNEGRVAIKKTIRYNMNYPLDNILFTSDDTYKTF